MAFGLRKFGPGAGAGAGVATLMEPEFVVLRMVMGWPDRLQADHGRR
jgi:hypothetical protein